MTRSVIQILVSLLCCRNAQRIAAAPACPFKHTVHYSFKYIFVICYAYNKNSGILRCSDRLPDKRGRYAHYSAGKKKKRVQVGKLPFTALGEPSTWK